MRPVGQATLVWSGAKTLRANAHVCDLEKEQAQESRLSPEYKDIHVSHAKLTWHGNAKC